MMSSSDPVGFAPGEPKSASVRFVNPKGRVPHVLPGGRRKNRSSAPATVGGSRMRK
jgi:hypothetical protein